VGRGGRFALAGDPGMDLPHSSADRGAPRRAFPRAGGERGVSGSAARGRRRSAGLLRCIHASDRRSGAEMSADAEIEKYRARLRAAMSRIDELRAALEDERRAHTEPVAILGMGCRFPAGVRSPEAFFDLLLQGTDAISSPPEDRFSGDTLGAARGGYLDDV